MSMYVNTKHIKIEIFVQSQVMQFAYVVRPVD